VADYWGQVSGARGKRLLRRRGEYLERTFAHAYVTGGMRRTLLRRHTNIVKRVLIHASGFTLGLLMRKLLGVGTPRGLQGRSAALIAVVIVLCRALKAIVHATRLAADLPWVDRYGGVELPSMARPMKMGTCTTGC